MNSNGYFNILDDNDNTIGRYRQDGTYIEINLEGDPFVGQFDGQYYDEEDENFWVKKMVLIPEDEGKVLILYNSMSVIDSLSNYTLKPGEAVTIHGYFQSSKYALYYNNIKTIEVVPASHSMIKYYVPNTITPGTYTVYLEDQLGDFTISNRKEIQILP
ncbi:MAG: hypothetical protein MI975_03085 [Cytophagales bacterium]|nr:hypothetical protein [Cytophagales bacterium]